PNANFEKREFRELWERINRKAAYSVRFDSPELIRKCVDALNLELKVNPLQYTVHRGEQADQLSMEGLKDGKGFEVRESQTVMQTYSAHSTVKYDLVGTLAESTQLTRRTIVAILQGIQERTFLQYKTNPEDFLREAGRIIKEQKATVIIEHLVYSPVDESFSIDIFTREKPQQEFDKAVHTPQRNIHDYVFTQSQVERSFVKELDASVEVAVYTKLPRGFFIPTPVGEYNPDWAIAFQEGQVKHVYFVAETKGSMSSLELREIERSKIECARKFFAKITSDQVKYDVVNSFGKLLGIVKS
ncbi:MAG TPA: restriction endonuclease subunit R, partial [Fibrobacteria bacterium]|nr:restriction endonuclease subunit R [Fibrobacteria bacterium]